MADRVRTTLTINKETHEYLRQFAPNDHAIGSVIDSLVQRARGIDVFSRVEKLLSLLETQTK
jgi:hypothetical protein